jgi:hypothetical protein
VFAIGLDAAGRLLYATLGEYEALVADEYETGAAAFRVIDWAGLAR